MITRDWIEANIRTFDTGGATYADVLPDRVAARTNRLAETIGARIEEIGRSRSGQHPLLGVTVGDGSKPTIALTGNCHAEEVVGTLTILRLLEEFHDGGLFAELRKHVRIVAIPQMNPDGVMNNWSWLSDPSPKARLAFCWRDHRAEDVEHGIAEDGEVFQRPEPRALMEFYGREAVGARFYATLHSSHWEAGAYFLTGNESEGVMAPAWALIRDLVEPIAGIPLYDEDLRGFQNYRRIGEGVYNVPRRGEMQRTLEAAGASVAKGFRLNSLEWMERRGTALSFVSEVPTITARAFTQEEIPGVPALALVAPVVPLLERAVREREALLTVLSTTLRSKVTDERRLRWANEEFYGGRNRKAEQFASFLYTFAGRTALRHHEARLVAHPRIDEVKLAGFAVATLGDCPERLEWQRRLDEAYETLDQTLGLTMTPIAAQVRLQLLLILSGTMVALTQRSG